jgi:hypothetical protein
VSQPSHLRAAKKILTVLAIAALVWGYERWNRPEQPERLPESQTQSSVPSPEQRRPERADAEPRPNSQFEGEGSVVRVLSDDNKGSRHQRFIVRLASGRTVLIAHNIDLAPRVDGLSAGDTVAFYGEFEDNEQGGVVHWTHHDPAGRHVGGWIRHRGRTYQ